MHDWQSWLHKLAGPRPICHQVQLARLVCVGEVVALHHPLVQVDALPRTGQQARPQPPQPQQDCMPNQDHGARSAVTACFPGPDPLVVVGMGAATSAQGLRIHDHHHHLHHLDHHEEHDQDNQQHSNQKQQEDGCQDAVHPWLCGALAAGVVWGRRILAVGPCKFDAIRRVRRISLQLQVDGPEQIVGRHGPAAAHRPLDSHHQQHVLQKQQHHHQGNTEGGGGHGGSCVIDVELVLSEGSAKVRKHWYESVGMCKVRVQGACVCEQVCVREGGGSEGVSKVHVYMHAHVLSMSN